MNQKVLIAIGALLLGLLMMPLFSTLKSNDTTDKTNTTPQQQQYPGPPGMPWIVSMDPPNGATDVDPGTTALVVTFNVQMMGGFSWTGGPPKMPTIPAGQKPRWNADKKTCVLPVALEPNRAYRLGLNSRSFKNFKSTTGLPLEPVTYTFTTGD